MDFSHLIDPESPLSPALQVVGGAGIDLETQASLLLSLLESGRLPFNPADRFDGLGWSLLDFVLVCSGSPHSFEQARPLAQWLVEQGQSPWETKSNPIESHGRNGYEVAASHGSSSAVMAWCWGLDDAPPRSISPVSAQVDHDELAARLRSGVEPMSKNLMDSLESKGIGLFEPWSNGTRPVDLLFEHARPGDTPLTRAHGSSARAPHDWLAILRDISRVGHQALKHHASPDDVFHLRAVLWANAHYASLRGNFDPRPQWIGTLVKFDQALAKAKGWTQTGVELHDRAHRATLDWLLARPGFPMARLAMEVALGEVGEFTAQVFGNPSRSRQVEALLGIGERVASVVEQFPLGVEPQGSEGWGWDPWRRAWTHLNKAFEHYDFDGQRSAVWEDPRVWSLGLPALALVQVPVVAKPTGADLLEIALERGNLWPEIESRHEIMESRAWSDALRAQVVAHRMSSKLPGASPSPIRPRF